MVSRHCYNHRHRRHVKSLTYKAIDASFGIHPSSPTLHAERIIMITANNKMYERNKNIQLFIRSIVSNHKFMHSSICSIWDSDEMNLYCNCFVVNELQFLIFEYSNIRSCLMMDV